MTEPIRVLVADDHPLFRDGLRVMLESVDDVEVLGEAATGEDAVALAISLRPDVVLMDVKMPGINGIEATRRVVQAHPEIQVLMLTENEPAASRRASALAERRAFPRL